MRIAARGLRLVILAAFAVFFVIPIGWLILAPIVFLTANGDEPASILRGYKAGAVDYLQKPIVPEILRAKVAIFLELNALHLIGSVLSVILPFSFFPFGVYLAYLYYATAIPRDLLDAARVDGAGEWQTFRRVALPLAKPIVALVFFFSFVAGWNNFFLPYAVLADSSQYPIQVGLSNLLSSTPSFNPAQGGGGQQVNIFRPELALATLLAVIPVAIVFLLSQRALVRGMLGGAVKQ